MRVATVHLEDGTSYQTQINGTDEDINQYFVGTCLNRGVFPNEKMVKVVSVDIEPEEAS